MKKILKIILVSTMLMPAMISCNADDSSKKELQKKQLSQKHASMSIFIDCDSIYPREDVKIAFIEHKFGNNEPTAFLQISKNGRIIVNDSLSTSAFAIEFKDFNGDGVKDVLAQNSSDARSNWTWHLYLSDLNQNSFKRIRGFEQIKNPIYSKEHDLIINLVMSGVNWSSFYQIQGDTIHDFGFVVESLPCWDSLECLEYDKRYKNELKKVLSSKNYLKKNNLK